MANGFSFQFWELAVFIRKETRPREQNNIKANRDAKECESLVRDDVNEAL